MLIVRPKLIVCSGHLKGHPGLASMMGRGGYDLTDPTKKESAMGDAALKWEDDDRRDREV
jgi:hypothetical protein